MTPVRPRGVRSDGVGTGLRDGDDLAACGWLDGSRIGQSLSSERWVPVRWREFGFAALPIREIPERGGQGSPASPVHGRRVGRRPDLNPNLYNLRRAQSPFFGRSRIDQVEAPSIGHAFEVVNATILKPDSRLGHQVLHRARDQYFAGARLCSYTRANMNRDADDLISNQFVFARMQPRPDLQPESADGLTDCSRASNRPGWRRNVASIPSPVVITSLPRSARSSLTHHGVIVIHYLRPATVAESRGFLSRANNIDKQSRGKHAI